MAHIITAFEEASIEEAGRDSSAINLVAVIEWKRRVDSGIREQNDAERGYFPRGQFEPSVG